MAVTIEKVVHTGGDHIRIRARDENGEKIVAHGSLSAMTNHYPPSEYRANGHLKNGATAREMTQAEKVAYWTALVEAARPTDPDTDDGRTVLYTAP